MALFKRDFSKPGPGVPKNAPKKKGFARFFEIFSRDFSSLVKLNLWYILCCLPSIVFFVLALFGFLGGGLLWFLLFGLLALAGGTLVGTATTATFALITRMFRDEPAFVGHEFRRLFKENFKSTAIPGVIYSLLLGSQVIAFLYYFLLGGSVSTITVVLYMFSILVFNMAAPYYFMQAAYIELDAIGILKNSLLFAMGYLPRTLGGLFISLLVNAAQVVLIVFFPPAILLPTFIGITVPMLVQLMWYWPQVDKTFNIDKTLKGRNTEAMDERMMELGEHDKVVNKREEEDEPPTPAAEPEPQEAEEADEN